MAGHPPLYTSEVLKLATELSHWPDDPALSLRGTARSATCGSTLSLGLAADGLGRITGLGIRAQACAIGQASAALFAKAAIGRDAVNLQNTLEDLHGWLKQGQGLPDWPGLTAIAAARDYPARHGAITLAWEAALQALSSPAKPG